MPLIHSRRRCYMPKQSLISKSTTVAVMSPPVTAEWASTASIPVVAVWLVDSIITGQISTSTIPGTSERSACGTSTNCRTSSGSRSSILTRCESPHKVRVCPAILLEKGQVWSDMLYCLEYGFVESGCGFGIEKITLEANYSLALDSSGPS